MTKKLISKEVDTLYVSYTSLKDLKAEIDRFISAYGEDAYTELEQQAYSDSFQVSVYAEVLETEVEYQTRLQQEDSANKRREEHERKEYQRLQKKFGEN